MKTGTWGTIAVVTLIVSATIFALAKREEPADIVSRKTFSFSGKTRIVIVESGDSLGKFARKLKGITWQNLSDLNINEHPQLKERPSHLTLGWKIKLPVIEN